jgi:hypothetical protein
MGESSRSREASDENADAERLPTSDASHLRLLSEDDARYSLPAPMS